VAVGARTNDAGGDAPHLAASDEAIPAMIDRYEILRKLATGGMAELFLAKQSGLEGFEKVVVIKRILSHLAQDEEFVSMFLDEARIAAKLSHPNIVQIYDLGKADDSYYIAMEYVSGRNVQHLMNKVDEKDERIPIEHGCRVIAGVCDGLHYAHSRKDYDGQPLNIVHRDISPQNILVSFAGGVKVVDFGIAKASTQLAQTRAGVLKGKYAYMSPEQVRGQKVDHRSDIFALGLVMYEMLTGRRAFERESSLKTLKAIVQEKPLNPRELNPEIPIEVIKLLSRALEKSPDRRYKNAQEMQLALEDYLESSPKKSNNVRLSRYLYELFDDELNSESGTMIVQGIGEVIIPTGANLSAERNKVEVADEVDSQTLSAALMPSPDNPNPNAGEVSAEEPTRTSAGRPEEELSADSATATLGRRRPSEPGVRVVRDDQASGHMPSASGPAAGAHTGVEESEALFSGEDESDEEPEDKTIPVYDLEDYEKHRANTSGATEDPGGDISDDPTMGGLPPNAGFSDSGEPTSTRDDRRAAELLAKVDAMAEGLQDLSGEADAPTIPPPTAGTEDEQPAWEDPTQAAPPGSPMAPIGSLHSDEAVVGPNGVIKTGNETNDSGIRPPAAGPEIRPAVRPAAKPGGPPTASPDLREVTRPPSQATPPPPPAGPATGASPAIGRDPTPTTSRTPAAQAAKPKMPGWAIAAIAAMGLFFVLGVVGLVVLLTWDPNPSPPAAAAGAPRILNLDTKPSGLVFRHNGVPLKTPAAIIVPSGARATIEVDHEGKTHRLNLEVPPGNAPLDHVIDMTAQPAPAP
jgi:serine/threonine protein kinase